MDELTEGTQEGFLNKTGLFAHPSKSPVKCLDLGVLVVVVGGVRLLLLLLAITLNSHRNPVGIKHCFVVVNGLQQANLFCRNSDLDFSI